MSMLSEFKTFIMRGNVIDMAVGIVVGAAFKDVVTSLVNDVIMPPIGWITGGVNFSKMKWVLKAAGPDGKGGVAISYGAFINTVITFIIISLVIFLMVKLINRMHKKKEEAPAAPPADVALLTEIRDLLKNRAG
ncbi:MAG TPA: large-conductance mechanosensitive channel protein MscL [Rhodanobacteraceae bacterium]|nr:large-conductance mechanosensitive channel protein MscL [Rhodanobacteraceae bacterium]